MHLNPIARKVIDASKLANFKTEKFLLPVKPIQTQRYITLRHTPTREILHPATGRLLTFVPGHIDLQLSKADMVVARTDFDPTLKDHPIVGDPLYAAPTGAVDRMLLHAQALSLPHPVTGAQMRFESTCPF